MTTKGKSKGDHGLLKTEIQLKCNSPGQVARLVGALSCALEFVGSIISRQDVRRR